MRGWTRIYRLQRSLTLSDDVTVEMMHPALEGNDSKTRKAFVCAWYTRLLRNPFALFKLNIYGNLCVAQELLCT